ncbi:Uma2 family endonuclease [Rhodopirellula islandica]|nr:Uma2 family endonuclease [Rhodopirellula islandica]
MQIPGLPNATANAALPLSVADTLTDLGGISSDRLRVVEASRPAAAEDLAILHAQGVMCELVDGQLVEKQMGFKESLLAAVLIEFLSAFARQHKLGIVSGPDGFVTLFPDLIRGPDVAFLSWDRLPGGRLPEEAFPRIVPDLVVEVLSPGNTRAEMARKRREYFHAGVRLVWTVDPIRRSVAIFTTATQSSVLGETESLDGGDVLPGLKISLAEVFAVLDGPDADENPTVANG